MFYSFLESFKYVGHLFPLVILRVYMGVWFLDQALEKYRGDFLSQPRLAALITDNLPAAQVPDWYRSFMDSVVVPHWQIFAYTQTYFEFLIGVGLILGFLVRPISLAGFILALQALALSLPEQADFHRLHVIVFLTLAWLGAGRCLGMDYYFFKRQRGWLW